MPEPAFERVHSYLLKAYTVFGPYCPYLGYIEILLLTKGLVMLTSLLYGSHFDHYHFEVSFNLEGKKGISPTEYADVTGLLNSVPITIMDVDHQRLE